jgi:hypothetical protein
MFLAKHPIQSDPSNRGIVLQHAAEQAPAHLAAPLRYRLSAARENLIEIGSKQASRHSSETRSNPWPRRARAESESQMTPRVALFMMVRRSPVESWIQLMLDRVAPYRR